ncbi:MAG: DAK2 domain-containing protein [Gaiellaceae bacterium]
MLREAGVVDAGGAGLVEIVRGLHAGLPGVTLPAPPPREELSFDAVHRELSAHRYCTVFLVEGAELDSDGLETQLERLGDSLLVVGDRSALKVHVHTDDPGAALSLGTAIGTIAGVEIADMHRQTAEREQRLEHADPSGTAVVAVVAGAGNRRLFESLGARVVEGGQTMNPSTKELLAAIEATGAAEVIVLPGNANVILSAEQAATLAERPVRVLRTESIQTGLAAMVAFDADADAETNAAEMTETMAQVATGEVTVASRDVELNGFPIRKGNWLGLADGEPVAEGDSFDEVTRAVVERLLAEPRGVLTLLTGADPPPLDALLALVAERYPDVELDVQDGGQPHYPLLLSAE